MHRVQQRGISVEIAGLDGAVDAGELLVNHPPSTDVQVPHLRVAHLPLGRPTSDSDADERVGMCFHSRSQLGLLAWAIALSARPRGSAKPVEDDKENRRGLHEKFVLPDSFLWDYFNICVIANLYASSNLA
jgi:hypothetical protein